MPKIRWQRLKEFSRLWSPPLAEPGAHAAQVLNLQRNIVLPAKLVILAAVFYYLFFSHWMTTVAEGNKAAMLPGLQNLMVGYIFLTVGISALLLVAARFPLRWVPWVVFLGGLADGILLAAMTAVTGGFESTIFWAFAGLIVINAFSLPVGAAQIMLNLLLSALFMSAGIWNANTIINADTQVLPPPSALHKQGATPGTTNLLPAKISSLTATGDDVRGANLSPETYLVRLIVLWLLTACCYGAQALIARQRQIEEEAREFAARQGQLRAAGRLAAEIAHQIKNPLAIINNAAFSLRRALANGKTDVAEQIRIIQEEVERSDRIITQLMGYARLTEGRVEKIIVAEELDRAVAEVFPPAVGYEVQVERNYADDIPPLVMQRGHLLAVLINLLQNAREALDGHGFIRVSVRTGPDFSVEIIIEDDGPGIPAEQSERIFEAYFTTKEKGTGLGLAIVKHNVDLYGGTIRVQSALGKGARFVLTFPAKTLVLSPKET